MSAKKTFAKDLKCCVCGKQAAIFWPVIDPDIPSNPYCSECVEKEKLELMVKLMEIDKKYGKK